VTLLDPPAGRDFGVGGGQDHRPARRVRGGEQHPLRGERNEPARVLLVAAKIAALKGLSPEAVGEAATRNLERLFGLGADPARAGTAGR